MKTRSIQGVEVDFSKYMAIHENQIALGNARMNARGDLLGQGGAVVKPREAVTRDYYSSNPRAVRQVSIKDMPGEMLTPAEAVAKLDAQTIAAQTAAAQTVTAQPAAAPRRTRNAAETEE